MNRRITNRIILSALASALGLAVGALAGCGSPEQNQQEREFHTSGSREADQRAEQRVAKVQQLRGEGSGGGSEKGEPGGEKGDDGPASLYERLGGEQGVALIVEDWVNRAIADPRVNWERKGVKKGGFGFDRGESVEWANTPENGTRMKKHIAQFVALSTGGPPAYQGDEMRASHADLRITNAEFDAAVGDLKASLDNLGIPTQEQKELLAIVETTRPQVVTSR